LGHNVRVATRRAECGQKVLMRTHVAHYRARLDDSRPTDQGRHAKRTFPPGRLFAFEWRGPAVRPAHHLSAVIGRINDDGVVQNTEVFELLQQLSYVPVVLHHTVRVEAKARLSLRLGLEMGKDMHPRRVEPAEERLFRLLLAFHKIQRSREELL